MYKIGDKVIYQGADKAAYKREGIVVSVEITNGKQQLTVELDGGEYFTAPIDDWSRKFDNSARNAKLAVGDKVRVWQYPIRGQYGKVVKVGLMEYDVEVAGKVYPKIDYRYVVKMPAANACASTNSVVRNAMAARNAGTIFGEDLDEVSAKLEKCVKGLRGVLEKLRPIQSERNRYIAEGNKYVFVSTPQGDRTSVNRYKKLSEEFSDLVSYTRG